MIADLVVENKQGQQFIVEVKSAQQDRKFPYAVEQIKGWSRNRVHRFGGEHCVEVL